MENERKYRDIPDDAAEVPQDPPPRLSLEKQIEHLINSYSAENESNTPDFILASYLTGCLAVFNNTVNKREAWYGRREKYDGVGQDLPQNEQPSPPINTKSDYDTESRN